MASMGVTTYNFAVVVVQNKEGKFLAVNETRQRGWWLPAGRVEPGESFEAAAHRETMEEAGIKVELKGILRVEYSPGTYARMRVVFYATPVDDTPPKDKPDKESLGASWVTVEDLMKLKATPPGLRGDELVLWGNYLNKGGQVYPLSIFASEMDVLSIQ